MIKLPFKFEDCISAISPFTVNGSKNSIVIYPVDDEQYNEKIKIAEESIIRGYLYSAKLIVDSIYRDYSEPAPQDDRLALPLLSLYSCALEFCLKLLKKKLEEHRENKTCSTIAKPKNSVSPFNHDLCELSKTVESIFPKKGKIHHFENFTEILDFIKSYYGFGITLESTRYCYDKKNTTHLLHTQQSFVILDKLNENITYICDKILDYINNPEFNLCEAQEFSQTTLSELRYIQSIMIEMKPSFSEFNNQQENISKSRNGEAILTYSDISDEIPLHRAQEREFYKNTLSLLNHKKLAALVMGLYYSRSPETVTVTLAGLEKWDRKTLEEKILERIHLFNNAEEKLIEYIMYIETTIKNRL